MNNESVGKKIVEALKKQAEIIDTPVENDIFSTEETESTPVNPADVFAVNEDIFAEPAEPQRNSFFDDLEDDKEPVFVEPALQASAIEMPSEGFEMPSNIAVLKKLISQLPSGVSRHTGAQIIKQTMEALGISMKSVLQDAQQVQESLKVSARECQGTIQEYKKQILALEKQSQNYQKQYSALNDLISLFIQTTR